MSCRAVLRRAAPCHAVHQPCCAVARRAAGWRIGFAAGSKRASEEWAPPVFVPRKPGRPYGARTGAGCQRGSGTQRGWCVFKGGTKVTASPPGNPGTAASFGREAAQRSTACASSPTSGGVAPGIHSGHSPTTTWSVAARCQVGRCTQLLRQSPVPCAAAMGSCLCAIVHSDGRCRAGPAGVRDVFFLAGEAGADAAAPAIASCRLRRRHARRLLQSVRVPRPRRRSSRI